MLLIDIYSWHTLHEFIKLLMNLPFTSIVHSPENDSIELLLCVRLVFLIARIQLELFILLDFLYVDSISTMRISGDFLMQPLAKQIIFQIFLRHNL